MDKHTPEQLQRQPGERQAPIEQRILRRRKVTPNGCWEFMGARNTRNYGQTTVGSMKDGSRRVRKIHALAYELWVGEVPEGMELDHLCRNPPCFNPAHLEAVTHQENLRRAYPEKSECFKGHPYVDGSFRIDSQGRKKCRACRRERAATQRARRQAA
jgi:hypothetical protein